MARHPLIRTVRPAGGFTLVEILVVLAILAALIGLVMSTVPAALRAKEVTRARSLVNGVGVALTNLKNDQDAFGRYPPTAMRQLKFGKHAIGMEVGQNNDVNCGIETVWFLLNNDSIRIDSPPSTDDSLVGNTDGDSYRVARGTADALAREYIDPWGRPLVYFYCNDYKEPKGLTTIMSLDEETIEVRPRRISRAAGGGWLFPNEFQLFSLGPNGRQDDPDEGEEGEEGDDIIYGVSQ